MWAVTWAVLACSPSSGKCSPARARAPRSLRPDAPTQAGKGKMLAAGIALSGGEETGQIRRESVGRLRFGITSSPRHFGSGTEGAGLARSRSGPRPRPRRRDRGSAFPAGVPPASRWGLAKIAGGRGVGLMTDPKLRWTRHFRWSPDLESGLELGSRHRWETTFGDLGDSRRKRWSWQQGSARN